MNLADPDLELIDPTPNVHILFLHFDKLFFWTKLASRAVVRWSKRMYSCAGICSYEGRGGLCDIALSEPLLKLRPRKDLVETLLHEMIHAYLFITCRDRERDGHGPNFKAHMHRINRSAGLNISIYHDFHDEVELYQTHWWRCNGPCQTRRPFYGIVRRPQNRAPGKSDFWWSTHQKTCGGTFVKIKEPSQKTNKGKKNENNIGDITKYITNNNNKTINNNTTGGNREPLTPVLKNINKTVMKGNGGKTLVITQKNIAGNTTTKINAPITAFSGFGKVLNPVKNLESFAVNETVRNVWANKQLPGLNNTTSNKFNNELNNSDQNKKPTKHKADTNHSDSPPPKIKKIDEYFKNTASSLLKDLYGQDIKLTQENDKIIALPTRDLVDCPICNQKVESSEINKHLDECLNKDVIKQLSKDSIKSISQGTSSDFTDRKSLKDIVESLPHIPAFKKKDINDNNKMFKEENGDLKSISANETVDLTHINVNFTTKLQNPIIKEENVQFDSNDVNRVKTVAKRINYDKNKRKSDNFVVPKQEENEIDCGFLPSFLDDIGTVIKVPKVKIEPGTSKGKDIENGDIKPISANETVDLTHINVNFTSKVQNPIIKEENIQFDLSDVNRVKAVVKRINYDKNIRKSDNFVVPKQEENEIDCGFLPSFLDDMRTVIKVPKVKIEPGTSKDIVSSLSEQKCPCCGNVLDKPMVEHLDECLSFFDSNKTIPEEGASTSFANNTIVIDDDDDDIFDETMTMNATGTKTPCPCCMKMVEMSDMNSHLDSCLS